MENEIEELYASIQKIEAIRDLLKAAMKEEEATWEDNDDLMLNETVSEALHGKYKRIERLQEKIGTKHEKELVSDYLASR